MTARRIGRRKLFAGSRPVCGVTKKNGGQASAFNAAIPELRGDIVAFLDGDDWFAPGKLTAVMNALEEHPEAASVGHGHYEVHEETNEVRVNGVQEAEFFHLATREAAAKRCADGIICLWAL